MLWEVAAFQLREANAQVRERHASLVGEAWHVYCRNLEAMDRRKALLAVKNAGIVPFTRRSSLQLGSLNDVGSGAYVLTASALVGKQRLYVGGLALKPYGGHGGIKVVQAAENWE